MQRRQLGFLFWDILRRNLAVELFDSRLLFWMEPHVLIWRSLVICSVHARLCSPGLLGGAGRCLPSGPEPAQQPPACSCLFPVGPGCRQGTELQWCAQLLAAVSLCPAPPITEWSCDRCQSSPRRGRSRRALDLRGVCHTITCLVWHGGWVSSA